MGVPEPVENEFQMVDGKVKGSPKTEREQYLEKQIGTLKGALNGANDKANALKKTYQRSMDDMKAVNDKLQKDNMQLVEKHDDRLMKYMELVDESDVMEAALKKLGYDAKGEAIEAQ